MAKFLSPEWIQLYQEKWNSDADLVHDLRKMTTTMKYYIEGEDQEPVFIRLEKGKAVESGVADKGKYDYVMWATRAHWKELASGSIGPKRAMAMRKLKFKGSMITAMRHLGPFGRSLAMMSEVETEW